MNNQFLILFIILIGVIAQATNTNLANNTSILLLLLLILGDFNNNRNNCHVFGQQPSFL